MGLNGLGACATQYSSEYMDVTVVRDKTQYTLHFEKGENVGGLQKSETRSVQTGTVQKWKPDTEVFTDINIPIEFFQDMRTRFTCGAREFVNRWSECGPTHHFAAATGRHIDTILKVAKIFNVPVDIVTR